MSISFRCPECLENVKVSATLAGMHSPCPSCYVSIPVPQTLGKGDDDRPHTEIHSRGDVMFHLAPPAEKLPAVWLGVLTGMALLFAGGVLWLAISVLVGIAFFTTALAERFTAFPVASALLVNTAFHVSVWLLPVCGFLYLAGWAFCLAVPRGAQARRWVIVGWIGVLLGTLAVVGYLLTLHRQREGMPISDVTLERLDIALGVVVLLLHLVLAVFLFSLARFLQEASLARQSLLFALAFAAFAMLVGTLDAIAGGKAIHVIGTAGYVLLFVWLEYLVGRTAWQIWRGL